MHRGILARLELRADRGATGSLELQEQKGELGQLDVLGRLESEGLLG